MFDKPTSQLNHEISQASSLEDFIRKNNSEILTISLSDYLSQLLEKKSLKRSNIVHNSNLSKGYVYDIFAGKRNPSRDKLIAISFGLNLSLHETNELLKYSGNRELYARNLRDSIVIFGLSNNYSILKVNELLYQKNLHLFE